MEVVTSPGKFTNKSSVNIDIQQKAKSDSSKSLSERSGVDTFSDS